MEVQTILKIDKALLELIKEKAASEKFSLNNFIEHILYKEMESIPNKETEQAILEARESKNLKPIEDLNQFLKNL